MYPILEAKKLADKIYLMVVKAPRISANCKPGEFVIVKMDENRDYKIESRKSKVRIRVRFFAKTTGRCE